MAIKLDKVDVVVVGTGWSGGIPSAELAKKGHKVVALERGKDHDHSDFVGSKDELRYASRYEIMTDNSISTVTARGSLDDEAFPLRTQRENFEGNNVGGSSVHWSGVTQRGRKFDLQARTITVEKYGEGKIPKDMNLQDMGISYDELEPYFDQFEKTAGTSGEEDPKGPPRSDAYPTGPMRASYPVKLFKEAASNLGYHPIMVPSANLSEQYENPDGETINACQYCSFCMMYGCDFGAKSDPVATVIPTAKKTGNFELRTNSYARRVTHKNGKATGVLYVDMRTGIEYEQPADVVILAGYPITNTRMMLLSKIGKPYDPKTGEGVIGKNSAGLTSPGGSATGFFEDKKFNLFMGSGALGGTFSDLDSDNIDNSDLDFIGGGICEIRQRGSGPIGSNPVPQGTPSWGKEYKEKSLYYNNRALSVGFMSPSFGWKFNYMDLDPNYTDMFNDPLLRITHSVTEQDQNYSEYFSDRAEEIMKEMGADIIEKSSPPQGWSHTQGYGETSGGVIMGDDPEISAVNNYSQVWDMENLFVIGASALTHKIPQQTGTIGALAYRAAEGIDKYLSDGGGLLVEKKSETQNA
ncbi:GMC family oxidoreductase [Pseudogracilibacillus sp. SE30717A]|uniref:GMC family oxidoreductase n=1 Tax=Pseudogracilibacillus sp. SE30717A TaxID=3098293 RepID=UPI00300E01AA